jgi:hypothetical protein
MLMDMRLAADVALMEHLAGSPNCKSFEIMRRPVHPAVAAWP